MKTYKLCFSAGIGTRSVVCEIHATSEKSAIQQAEAEIEGSAFAAIAHRANLWDSNDKLVASWNLDRKTVAKLEKSTKPKIYGKGQA